jgi:transposase-like protein
MFAAYIIFGTMMRTAYESGMETGRIEALQSYYLQTGVCMPEISNIIRICDAKLANVSQHYNSSS